MVVTILAQVLVEDIAAPVEKLRRVPSPLRLPQLPHRLLCYRHKLGYHICMVAELVTISA